MKKKILIALVMFLTLTTPVLASDTVSPGGSGSGSAGHSSAFETCKNGAGDWRRIGVRISAVDEMGRRLPGTSSIDILQNTSATGTFAGISGGNMQYVSFRVSANPNTEYYMNSNRGQMRNEALTSLNYVNTTSLLSISLVISKTSFPCPFACGKQLIKEKERIVNKMNDNTAGFSKRLFFIMNPPIK